MAASEDTTPTTDTTETTDDRVRLEPGQEAPAFSLRDADGNTVSLADFRGRSVVVYFYPKADTPGCTTEACDFRDSLDALEGTGTTVVGISPDPVEALAAFRDKHALTFPLLSDPDRTVLRAYGAYGQKKNYGKVVEGVIRSTVVVDPEGRVTLAKYNVKATGHVARIAKEIGAA